MRRAFWSVVLLVGAFLIVPASPATAAPYCGLVWGSLEKSAPGLSQAPVVNVRTGRHSCYDRLVIDVAGVQTITGSASGLVARRLSSQENLLLSSGGLTLGSGSSGLGLSSTELNTITTAGTLTIGSTTHTGTIATDGNVALTNPYGPVVLRVRRPAQLERWLTMVAQRRGP